MTLTERRSVNEGPGMKHDVDYGVATTEKAYLGMRTQGWARALQVWK